MRSFYTERYDFSKPDELEKELQALLNQPVNSTAELESWLKKQSYIYDAVEEALSGHYIDFQCNSNSEAAKKAFENDQKFIDPLFKKYSALLDEKFLENPYKDSLDSSFYSQFIKSKQNSKELFREKNIELEIEEDRLSTNYFEITGGLTIFWQGEEKTLSEVRTYLQDPDRTVRKKAMDMIAEAFLSKEEELQEIMTALINIRQKKTEMPALITTGIICSKSMKGLIIQLRIVRTWPRL
jgi:oligoendopeptidase F